MAVHCIQCGKELPAYEELRVYLDGKRVCNFKCLHDAGSCAHCGPDCGCTAYAIKRRMLREHRELLRCMECIISENNLHEELDALWQNNRDPRPGRSICLIMTQNWMRNLMQTILSKCCAMSWQTEAP